MDFEIKITEVSENTTDFDSFLSTEKFKHNLGIVRKEILKCYCLEKDKSLLETLAIYRTVREHCEDVIKAGKAKLSNMKDNDGIFEVYEIAMSKENKIIEKIRKGIPKNFQEVFGITELIKEMEEEDVKTEIK